MRNVSLPKSWQIQFFPIAWLVCIGVLGITLPVKAADQVIVQIGQTFLDASNEKTGLAAKDDRGELKKMAVKEIRLKKGDSIQFKNLDSVAHNVYSRDFDLKKQDPNDSKNVKFEQAGEFVVKCMIHPQMKFKLLVE